MPDEPPALRAPPRRLPARRRPRRVPRLGAAPGRGRAARRRPRARAEPTPATASSRRRSRPRRATTTRTCSTASSSPTPRSRWQPRRPARAARGCSTPARSPGPTTASSRPRSADSCSTSCTSARSRAEGTFDAAIPHLRGAARARRHRDRADAGRRVPRPPRLGLRRRLHLRRPRPLRRAGRACSGSSTPPTREGLARAARRRLQPRRRVRRRRRWRRSAPTSPSHYETPWGRAMNYDDDAVGRRARVGAARAPSSGSATSTSTACGWTPIHAIFDSNPEHLVAAVARRVHAAGAARDRDRRVRPERPEGDRDRDGWGCDARLGRRLPPRAARAAHRRPRGLLRGVRHARRRWRRRSAARTSTTARTRPSARRRFGAPRGRCSRRARSWSSPPTTTRSATARSATGCRAEAAPARRVLHAAVTVHADAVPWARSTASPRRSSSSPTTSTRRSRAPRGRAGGASSPPSPSSPARRCPTRRTRRPSSAPSSRARASRRASRDLYARAAARPRASCRRRRRRRRLRRARGLAARRAAAPYTLVANFSRRATCTSRCDGTAEPVLDHAPRHARARATWSCPHWPERCCDDRRSGRGARSRSAPPGTARARTSRSSPRTPSGSSCACSTTTTTRRASS